VLGLNERQSLLDNLENNLYFVCCMEPEHFKGDYTESSEYEFYCPVCDYELEPYDAEAEKKLLKREISKDKRNFKKIEDAINALFFQENRNIGFDDNDDVNDYHSIFKNENYIKEPQTKSYFVNEINNNNL
jgi:hypothetical protein